MVRQNRSEFLQFGRIFDKDGRGAEWEPSSASATPMDVDVVGKGKGQGCFVCGRSGHAAKDCKLNQGKGKGQSKRKTEKTTDNNSPAKFDGECRYHGKEGHTWADCWETSVRSERQESPTRLMERRINRGVYGASWGKVVQNRICSDQWKV